MCTILESAYCNFESTPYGVVRVNIIVEDCLLRKAVHKTLHTSQVSNQICLPMGLVLCKSLSLMSG